MAKRPAYSKLCKALEAGHFVFTGELEPKKIMDMSEIVHSAKEMKKTNRIIAADGNDSLLLKAIGKDYKGKISIFIPSSKS